MNSDGIAWVPPLLSRSSENALPEFGVIGVEHRSTERPTLSHSLPCGPNDESLLGDVSNGSKEALGILFRRYRYSVMNVAQRILRDASEAEDLCQEVFVFLFQKAKLFDASKGTASSWIIQIAYHRAINRRQYLAHRQHYNTLELDEEQIGGKIEPPYIDVLTARKLLNQLRGQLSEEQKETLELHFFEGYSLREIAEKTNQTLGNVRHHCYRGLDRLRGNLFPKKTHE
jgi:RNA polymerase sigma-70 factor, ECF subfamily